MRRVHLTMVVVIAVACGLAACQPVEQLEIDFTIRNTGTLTIDAAGDQYMTLSGVLACSKGTPGTAEGEPLDLFTELSQGDVTSRGLELYDNCSAPKVWTKTFRVDPRFRPGQVTVRIRACTNPGEPLNDDCAIDTEVVTLKQV